MSFEHNTLSTIAMDNSRIAKPLTVVDYHQRVRIRTSMTTKTTTFLTNWLRWHVVGRIASAEDVPLLVAKCLQDAGREGISHSDIEDAVGPLDDCIREVLQQPKR